MVLKNQMNWQSLEACFRTVLGTGELSHQWMEQYSSFVKDCQASLLTGARWPAEAFQVCHGVMLYLPLRYRAYVGSTGEQKPVTECALAQLRRKTELTLWASAAASQQDSDFAYFEDDRAKDPSHQIARLVLGNRSPVEANGSLLGTLNKWRQDYFEAVESFLDLWGGQPNWPRWTCLSLHFASLCIEFLIQREVPLGVTSTRKEIRDIVHAQPFERFGAGVRVLIERWLEWCDAPLDHSGLPEVGTIRRLPGGSIRTITENAILYPVVSHNLKV